MTKILKTVTAILILVSCNKAKTNETAENPIDSTSILTDTVLNLVQPIVDIDTISEKEFREFFKFTEAKYCTNPL